MSFLSSHESLPNKTFWQPQHKGKTYTEENFRGAAIFMEDAIKYKVRISAIVTSYQCT
jgi:hypothetical protein